MRETMEQRRQSTFDQSEDDHVVIPDKAERKSKGIELAEEKIAKQALLEALFNTQCWSEPYVTNPFLYVTDRKADFEGEEGLELQNYFKKVFYTQYNKYRSAIERAVP
jgi:hypothetical protein